MLNMGYNIKRQSLHFRFFDDIIIVKWENFIGIQALPLAIVYFDIVEKIKTFVHLSEIFSKNTNAK